MDRNKIIIRNTHTNNLNNIDIEISKHKLVVFTGASGSAKSSLLIDTIYTEAQRQLVGTFSTFARTRIPKLSRPDVGDIQNLSTAIVIVGLMFPVLIFRDPRIIENFIQTFGFPKNAYTFAIATCGGTPFSTLFQSKECFERTGKELSSCFSIQMVNRSSS